MKVEIDKNDVKQFKVFALGLGNKADKIMARAMNRTLSGVKTDISTAVRSDLNLPKKYVDKKISVYKPSAGNPTAMVTIASKPVGLINFTGTRETKKGVSVKVKKQGVRRVLKHAFIKKANNALNVWWRDPEGVPYRKKRPRFKFKPAGKRPPVSYPGKGLIRLTGPRLTDNLSEPTVINKIREQAYDRYEKQMDHEISRELKR